MSTAGSGNSGSNWPITKFIVAFTGLITAVIGLYAVIGNPFTPDPTPSPRSEVEPAGEIERQPDPQPTRTAAPSRESMIREVQQLQREAITALVADDKLKANRNAD